ncbi:hypothetical protein BH10BDE1_BH10BDE1_06010 [soil metagenome]
MENTPNPSAKPVKVKKQKKPKGPIRWEAITPLAIVVAIIWAYFFFFFDTHARRGLEYVATQANGAEVNIGNLKTSFWNASLEVNDIQVTNASTPAKNVIELGTMRWQMLWDALLRGKIAIEDASILEIRIGTVRKHPGRVLPPDPPGDSKFQKMKEEALDNAQKEFSQNVLGDAAALLQGTDPAKQLTSIGNDLKSSQRIKELEIELKKKQIEWNERIAKLPKNEELAGFEKRAKAIKLDGFSNPLEIQQSLQQIDQLAKDVDSKVKEVQATSQAVGSELKGFQANFDQLKGFVDKDIKDLQARLKIPSLDASSIAKSIFGPLVLSRVRQAEMYMTKARQYMPPKKTAEEKADFEKPKPHERVVGKNYKFGRPKAYPMFWLKKATLSSKETPDGPAGDMTGELKNVTDDQPMVGLPTTLSFKGRFPSSKIEDVSGLITVDHRTEEAVESLDLKVGKYPITEQKLIQSDEVQLGFKEATGSSHVKVELRGQQIAMTMESSFDKVAYDVSAKTAMVDQILKAIILGIPKVTLNAGVKGTWTDLQFSFDSNLGRELQAGFEKQLQAKINEAKAKLQAMIDDVIGKEKNKLLGEFASSSGDITKVLQGKEGAVNELKGKLEKEKNKALGDQKSKLQNEAGKAVEDLKKKFGF